MSAVLILPCSIILCLCLTRISALGAKITQFMISTLKLTQEKTVQYNGPHYSIKDLILLKTPKTNKLKAKTVYRNIENKINKWLKGI